MKKNLESTNVRSIMIIIAATSDKVYQLLVHGRWFSPASSTTKTGCHDIAEILLRVALNTKNSNSFILFFSVFHHR
jgi:hypothetical protein